MKESSVSRPPFSLEQYRVFAESLIDAAERNVAGVFAQLHSQATSTTSNALATNQQWPFVTIADFERRASETSGLASSDMILFSPIVKPEERQAWETYSTANSDWTITVSVACSSEPLCSIPFS